MVIRERTFAALLLFPYICRCAELLASATTTVPLTMAEVTPNPTQTVSRQAQAQLNAISVSLWGKAARATPAACATVRVPNISHTCIGAMFQRDKKWRPVMYQRKTREGTHAYWTFDLEACEKLCSFELLSPKVQEAGTERHQGWGNIRFLLKGGDLVRIDPPVHLKFYEAAKGEMKTDQLVITYNKSLVPGLSSSPCINMASNFPLLSDDNSWQQLPDYECPEKHFWRHTVETCKKNVFPSTSLAVKVASTIEFQDVELPPNPYSYNRRIDNKGCRGYMWDEGQLSWVHVGNSYMEKMSMKSRTTQLLLDLKDDRLKAAEDARPKPPRSPAIVTESDEEFAVELEKAMKRPGGYDPYLLHDEFKAKRQRRLAARAAEANDVVI